MNKVILGRIFLLLITLFNSTITGYFLLYGHIMLKNNFALLHFNGSQISLPGFQYIILFLGQTLIFFAVIIQLKYHSKRIHITDKFVVALISFQLSSCCWFFTGFFILKLLAIISSATSMICSMWVLQLLLHEKENIEILSKEDVILKKIFSLLNGAFCLAFSWFLIIVLLTVNNSIFHSLQTSKIWILSYSLVILLMLNYIGSVAVLYYKKNMIMASIIFLEIGLLLHFIDNSIIMNFIVIAILLNCFILYLCKDKKHRLKTLLETQFSE